MDVTHRFEILKAFEKYGWSISDKRIIEIMKERGFTISLNDIKIIRDLNQPKVTKRKVPLIPSSPIDWSSLGTPIIRQKRERYKIKNSKRAKIQAVFAIHGLDIPTKDIQTILLKDGVDIDRQNIAVERHNMRHNNVVKEIKNDTTELQSIRHDLLALADRIKRLIK